MTNPDSSKQNFPIASLLIFAACVVVLSTTSPKALGSGAIAVFFALAISGLGLLQTLPRRGSVALQVHARLIYTLALALALPCLLSLVLLHGAHHFNFSAAVTPLLSWTTLVPVVILSLLSVGVGGAIIDRSHPVTGILSVAVFLFLVVLSGSRGYSLTPEDFDPPDPEDLKVRRDTGYFVVLYWVYVATCYFGVIYGLATKKDLQPGAVRLFSRATFGLEKLPPSN